MKLKLRSKATGKQVTLTRKPEADAPAATTELPATDPDIKVGLHREPDQNTGDAEADAEANRTAFMVYPERPGAVTSRCTICPLLNQTLGGVTLRNQKVYLLDGEGNPAKRAVKAHVQIALPPPPKVCRPERNPNCPATETVICIGVNLEREVQRVLTMEAAGDYQGMAEVMASVARLQPVQQQSFRRKMEAARTNKVAWQGELADATATAQAAAAAGAQVHDAAEVR